MAVTEGTGRYMICGAGLFSTQGCILQAGLREVVTGSLSMLSHIYIYRERERERERKHNGVRHRCKRGGWGFTRNDQFHKQFDCFKLDHSIRRLMYRP